MKRFKKSEDSELFNDGIVEAQNEAIENGIVETIEEEVNEPEEIVKKVSSGVVVGCTKLNVRERPSTEAKVLCTVNKSETVLIDTEALTTPDFLKIITASGVEGYCVEKYISVK